MPKEMSVKPIEDHSAKSWKEWVKKLDSMDARNLKHKDIAILTRQLMDDGWWDKKKQPKLDWWAQGIAICYEQHCGMRIAGQQSDGLFAATISKTVSGDLDALFKKWLKNNIKDKHSEPRISHTPKRSYWRTNLEDDTKLEVAFEPKSEEKVLVSISQTKLADPSLMESQKAHWKKIIDQSFGV